MTGFCHRRRWMLQQNQLTVSLSVLCKFCIHLVCLFLIIVQEKKLNHQWLHVDSLLLFDIWHYYTVFFADFTISQTNLAFVCVLCKKHHMHQWDCATNVMCMTTRCVSQVPHVAHWLYCFITCFVFKTNTEICSCSWMKVQINKNVHMCDWNVFFSILCHRFHNFD